MFQAEPKGATFANYFGASKHPQDYKYLAQLRLQCMFLLHLYLIFGYAVNHKVERLKWMREMMMYKQMIGTCEVYRRMLMLWIQDHSCKPLLHTSGAITALAACHLEYLLCRVVIV